MSLSPKTYEESKARYKPLARTPLRAKSALRATVGGKTSPTRPQRLKTGNSTPRKALKSRPDPKLAAWAIRVKKRDGYRCQWAGCAFWHDRLTVVVAHHKALRSARPDLRLVDDNGITVCWDMHSVIHSPAGHDEAVKRGFLNLRTRELAAKENTLGVR